MTEILYPSGHVHNRECRPCTPLFFFRPFSEQSPARPETVGIHPGFRSESLFRIRCPDILAPQPFSEQADTMLAGHVRVSTLDQNPELQLDAP
ncbi:MAG: hypothetical protein OXI87_15370 [Albidovulum sp.]|nr:hypothetical protein [Albidovulum sp.]MDE0530020.1 hypothetical protein [Albidovulum sp.]